MKIVQSFRLALVGLSVNKLRSFLTMLGIIIGVAAVITLLSVGRGVQLFVSAEFEGLGNNLLFVFPGKFVPGQNRNPVTGRLAPVGNGLTTDDYLALSDPARAPSLKLVVPEYGRYSSVTRDRYTARTQVTGSTPGFTEVRNFSVSDGNFFSDQDVDSGVRVAVLGQTVYQELFPNGESPIGESIKINNVPFRVIGLLAAKGGSGLNDQDDVVLVPLTTAQRRLFPARRSDGKLRLDRIVAEMFDPAQQDLAIFDIQEVLRQTHKINYREQDDFSVLSQEEISNAFGQVATILTIFLGVIAGISLLVGGIGIMNIMLVSVTERTREIGLRKAVGARRNDILLQFLVEAMTLSLLGGFFGIIFGIFGARLIARFSDTLQTFVAWDSVLLAILFSAAVGLFFGIYPATRAAALRPIEALRYE
ncbi:MAG: ABC transporter permease [Ardenticatenales bacterium]|nr:ABC transporter permease [Ardenticatenales bacterium]